MEEPLPNGLAIFPGQTDDTYDAKLPGIVLDRAQRFAMDITHDQMFAAHDLDDHTTCRHMDKHGYRLTMYVRDDGADTRFNVAASTVARKPVMGIAILYDDYKQLSVDEFWKIHALARAN